MAPRRLSRPSNPGPLDAPFTGIWADMIDRNNRRYAAVGDGRYAVGNAPAREAHFVVRGGDKIAMLSVLNIATACKTIAATPQPTSMSRCVRCASPFGRGHEAVFGRRKAAISSWRGAGEFTPDPSYAVSYASYDVATKSIKLGVILAHKAVEKCSQIVPLYQRLGGPVCHRDLENRAEGDQFHFLCLLATAIFSRYGHRFPVRLWPQRNHGLHRALRDRQPHIHRRQLSTAFGYAHAPFAPAL